MEFITKPSLFEESEERAEAVTTVRLHNYVNRTNAVGGIWRTEAGLRFVVVVWNFLKVFDIMCGRIRSEPERLSNKA